MFFSKKTKRKGWLKATALSLSVVSASNVYAFSLENTPFQKAGARYNLDPLLLYAISLVESALNGREGVSPSPLALRTRYVPHFPATIQEAKELLPDLITKHGPSIDIGLMQINWRWHKDKVDDITDLLDPETNVMVGAEILRYSIDSKPRDYELGIGTYHSPTEIRARNYGKRVLAVHRNLRELVSGTGK